MFIEHPNYWRGVEGGRGNFFVFPAEFRECFAADKNTICSCYRGPSCSAKTSRKSWLIYFSHSHLSGFIISAQAYARGKACLSCVKTRQIRGAIYARNLRCDWRFLPFALGIFFPYLAGRCVALTSQWCVI